MIDRQQVTIRRPPGAAAPSSRAVRLGKKMIFRMNRRELIGHKGAAGEARLETIGRSCHRQSMGRHLLTNTFEGINAQDA